jgi:hypothetical protein
MQVAAKEQLGQCSPTVFQSKHGNPSQWSKGIEQPEQNPAQQNSIKKCMY